MHVYFDDNESQRFDTFIHELRHVGKMKVRTGDVTTALLLCAMEDDAFIRKVKAKLKGE